MTRREEELVASIEALADRWLLLHGNLRDFACTPILESVRISRLGQTVSARGDLVCHECGSANPCWRTDHDLWNSVMPDDGVLCPICFIRRADTGTGTWKVTAP